MSRAYRIAVKESLKRVVKASDNVSTQLGLLEILPSAEMAELLAEELERRGFEPGGEDGGLLVRKESDGITILVDPCTGTVTAQAEDAKNVNLNKERESRGYGDLTRSSEKELADKLRDQLRSDLDKEASQEQAALQNKTTERLEGRLGDLKKELDEVVNRVTAEALKRKAATMGQIKELTEDPENGSMTIVLEV